MAPQFLVTKLSDIKALKVGLLNKDFKSTRNVYHTILHRALYQNAFVAALFVLSVTEKPTLDSVMWRSLPK